MKKLLIAGASTLFILLLLVTGWMNTLGALNLGRAYQTINLVKLLENAELEASMRNALYSEMSVYRCELKFDKKFLFFRFTLGSYMDEAQLELEQIIQQKYAKEAADPASATICLADKTD